MTCTGKASTDCRWIDAGHNIRAVSGEVKIDVGWVGELSEQLVTGAASVRPLARPIKHLRIGTRTARAGDLHPAL